LANRAQPGDRERMSPYRPLAAVVLAAGEGVRLRSGTPKVLHELCGARWCCTSSTGLAELRVLERVVIVVGHGAGGSWNAAGAARHRKCRVEFVEHACSAARVTR